MNAEQFNQLLLHIIAVSSKDFCAKRLGQGATREDVNAELPAYLDALRVWQLDMLQRYEEWNEPHVLH